MSLNGIASSAQSLSYYQRLYEVTSNNLANANTDAFKAVRVAAENRPDVEGPAPIETIDLQQGVLRETGRPLDLALSGDGFLVVRTPNGERLTRGGALAIRADGLLTDANGNPVLGREGVVVLNGSKVEIQGDGSVFVDGSAAGQLRVDTVQDPATLRKEGAGRYIASTPLQPVDDGTTMVRQGSIEEANMDPIMTLVDLITIQRAYAANIDALKTIDSVLGVANDVGRV
jgi:flagellar basal body rod protein FlgG